VVTLVLSLLVIVMSIGVVLGVRACASGRIPRNPLVGLRVRWVLDDEEAWETGHRAAVPAVTAAAPVAVVVGIIGAVPALGEDARIILALAGLGVLVAGLVWGTVLAARAARASVKARS
jgi:hypothetical protein